jgi:DNA ligase-associated metallophosphoesterase
MMVELQGELMELLPERAMHWPARHVLLIADVHFGKAAAFRSRGVPVPRGTTSQNLTLLDFLVARHGIRHIIFLGDFLHARAAHASATVNALRDWRRRHPTLLLSLVRGNHDRHAGDPPTDLDMDLVDEPWHMPPFAMCHHPQDLDGTYVLAGHLHPVYRLASRHDSARLACFLLGERHGVLPAFGAFTGGYPIEARPGSRIYLVAEDRILPLPPMQATSGSGNR